MKDFDEFIDRIRKLEVKVSENSKETRYLLTRIGGLLEASIKQKIIEINLVKERRLLNSIRYRVGKNQVSVGSYGVPYAAVHEFGFRGRVAVRAHTRVTRSGKPSKVSPHFREMRVRERPYIRPSLKKNSDRIIQILREGFKP
jgi:phage gpG-like protein